MVAGLGTFVVAGPRIGPLLGFLGSSVMLLLAAALAVQLWHIGPVEYAVAGWSPPLGIRLYADGLSALMVLMTAVVGIAASVHALQYFLPHAPTAAQVRAALRPARYFWPMWLLMWASLNALFVSGDLFNIYVTLELVGLLSVALINLAGELPAVAAALRYLLVTLLGSLCYLLGVALLYGTYGTLDLLLLADRIGPGTSTYLAVALVTAGMLIKTALFPLHFWLPAAHANAPAPVSALLSALIVKAPYYLLLRLWFGPFVGIITPGASLLLGLLGAAAVLWGSVQGLLQARLKLLVAYSTVAQLGYLFLLFPLASTPRVAWIAFSGGVYMAVSHAVAKGAAFLAAGTILHRLGHDRIDGLAGVGQRMPLALMGFAIAGVSLIGLPPTGGFLAKWRLMQASFEGEQWWWALVLVVGGLLTAVNIFRVLQPAFVDPHEPVEKVPLSALQLAPFGLALVAVVLNFTAVAALDLLAVGAAMGPPPDEVVP